MFYRVVRTKNNQSSVYDFDDIEDAKCWIREELSFDENSDNPVGYEYSIVEVRNEFG